MIFLDTSALIKAYVTEQGTPTVRALVARFDGRLFANAFVALEVVATLSKKFRGKQLHKHEYQDARGKFLSDFFDSYEIVQISEPILTSAITLADNHRQNERRGYGFSPCRLRPRTAGQDSPSGVRRGQFGPGFYRASAGLWTADLRS